MRISWWLLLVFTACPVLPGQSTAQSQKAAFPVAIPRLWDEKELAEMTLPPARHGGEIVYVSSDYFYRTPGLEIYKTYPVYHPLREPKGYLDQLRNQESALVFDRARALVQRRTSGGCLQMRVRIVSSIDN